MPTVLITGAGRGYGRELFSVYIERGWHVFPLLRDPDRAEELSGIGGAQCRPIVGDVAFEKTEEEITRALANQPEGLDLLINNAGSLRKLRGIENTHVDDLETSFGAHCIGVFRCTRASLPYLRKARDPVVINITSRFGSISRTVSGARGGIYAYQIAKAAQNMLTACLDQELKKEGIRVFAVHPGRLKTAAAAPDADTEPRDAAVKLADWVDGLDRNLVCGCHDLMSGELIDW